MTRFAAFEWLKLTRRWMPRIIVFMMAGIIVLGFWGQGSRALVDANLFFPRSWLSVLVYTSFIAPFFWPVLGGSWAGNEYGWGIIRTILTRRPYRMEHALVAIAVLLIGTAVALLVLVAVGTVMGLAISVIRGQSVAASGVVTGSWLVMLAKGFLTSWYVSGFFLLAAYAAATVFRSSAVGIGLGIGGTFAQLILGRIFLGLGGIWNDIALQFPYRYAQNAVTQVVHGGMVPGSSLAAVEPGTPSAGASILALTVYSAVFLAITLVAVRARDVTA